MISFIDNCTSVSQIEFERVIVISSSDYKWASDNPSQSEQLLKVVGQKGLETIKELRNKTKTFNFKESLSESLVKKSDSFYFKLFFCVLPTSPPSRHAAYGFPHIIHKLVRKCKGDETSLAIFLMLGNPAKETFSSCCSISRAFRLYNGNSTTNDVRIFTCADKETTRSDELKFVCSSIQICAQLVDMPPNELNPSTYVNFINELFSNIPQVSIKTIQGEDLKNNGFGGLYGVGKASSDPPALVVLSCCTEEFQNQKSICFVGKGITYDSGGLSIKDKTNMCGMKRDMGGSAGCLGAFLSLVQSKKLTKPLHCLLCIAENSVSRISTRPDDIHILYSGKSVEINNTDAEGRLVMADGMAYAVRHLNPYLIINMATLTGAQSMATGTKHAAIITNSESLEKSVVESGRYSGDLCHPLPYVPEFYISEFKSVVANMKNSQRNRTNGGSIAPAFFIRNHIEDYLKIPEHYWLHIDMAGPCTAYELGTGYGVALLFHLIQSIKL